VLARRLRLEGNFDFRTVAKRTPGYVGADLAALMKEAAAVAVSRIFSRLEAARLACAAAAAGAGAAGAAGAAAGAAAPAAAAAGAATAEETARASEGAANTAPADGAAAVRPGLQVDGPSVGADADMAEAAEAAEAAAAAAALLAADVAAFSGAGFGQGPLGPAELAGLAITMADFEAALPKVQPSVRREGFTTTPDVTWDDVGALAEVRAQSVLGSSAVGWLVG
jgi:ribosome biogenesis ATPase